MAQDFSTQNEQHFGKHSDLQAQHFSQAINHQNKTFMLFHSYAPHSWKRSRSQRCQIRKFLRKQQSLLLPSALGATRSRFVRPSKSEIKVAWKRLASSIIIVSFTSHRDSQFVPVFPLSRREGVYWHLHELVQGFPGGVCFALVCCCLTRGHWMRESICFHGIPTVQTK